MKSIKWSLALAILSAPTLLMAQSPIGGFMQGKGKGNVVVSYSRETYDQVYLVPAKVNGVPVFNKVTTESVSTYATIGLSSKVDFIANIPYVSRRGEASQQVLTNLGYTNLKEGLQDVSFYIKYNPYNFKIGKGTLALVGALGIDAPLSDYKVNEGLQSIIAIGNHATKINSVILAQYKSNCGIFVSGQLGYSIRNNDVPNAFSSEVKIGYAAKHFYVDAYSSTIVSTSGTDILKEGFQGFFPGTKVVSTKIGGSVYVPLLKGLGVAGGASSYVQGRNLGVASGYYAAIIYSF